MKFSVFHTFKDYKVTYLPKDLLTGIIIALVSIPISMGYAQIAGLPAVYGLYGSVFPILFFAIFTTSRQFVFGVDAAPAALVGAALLSLEIEPFSDKALAVVPVITFFTGIWLFLFYFFRAGKLVNFISLPVMGGFISGICCTIILMQIPKLFGGTAGTGELVELISHLIEQTKNINMPSLALGISSLTILLIAKKLIKKFPMAVVIMAGGAILSYFVPLKDYGITLLSSVAPGLPAISLPDFSHVPINDCMGLSLSIAVVIMAETLLSENNFATQNGYKINNNQELFAFFIGNMAAAFTGCCPINGSVSRTSMSDQYGGCTQLSSIIASITMIFVLLFGTGFIGYLPVPILTAIVISALMGALEFHLARKLFRINNKEFYIFVAAFLGVLLLGTIYGVLIGVVLSFVSVIIRASDPPRGFLGMMPGHTAFFNITKFKHVYPIEHVVIYRFSSNLFFANISTFQDDIENAIKPDTEVFIIDASGIGSMDITSAERIALIRKMLKKRGIKFYITEHVASLNAQMFSLGIGDIIRDGCVRRTIDDALSDAGFTRPYKIEGTHMDFHSVARKRAENTIQEFVWAFGEKAEEEIEKIIMEQIDSLKNSGGSVDEILHGSWNQLGSMDEDEWLEHLEAHLTEIAKVSGNNEYDIARHFEERRQMLANKIASEHPELAKRFEERRHHLDVHLKQHRPEVYAMVEKLRKDLKK